MVIAQNIGSWTGDPDPVRRSPLEQRWNLFAPDPPRANLHTQLWYRTADGTQTGPIDLSDLVRTDARDRRLLPPKLVRVLTDLNVRLERGDRDAATGEAFRRVLSGASRGLAEIDVEAVRGRVVRTPVAPPDERADVVELIFDSGWLQAADVVAMRT